MGEPDQVGRGTVMFNRIMSTASNCSPVTRQLKLGAMALGLWGGLVLLFTTQFMLVGSFSWRDAFTQAVFFWGLWVLFMPTAVLLAFDFPLERSRLLERLGIHLLTCVLVVVISQFAFRTFIPVPFPPDEAHVQRERGAPSQGFLSLRAGLDILVYWSLFGLCQAITNFRRSQQRERRAAELEARLNRSKLQALRMQINPHFLFNTLNAISTLIHVNPKAADEMVGDLSELLRCSLDNMEEQEIPLARELQFVDAYVGIERKRFGDRLRLEQSVPDELLEALVPALVFQPLVENAIRHGIEPRRAPGLITIRAEREREALCLVVQDNGKGMVVEGSKGKRPGIGLANTQARLRELYGKDQRLSFGTGELGGWTVEIRIPFHTEPMQLPMLSTEAGS